MWCDRIAKCLDGSDGLVAAVKGNEELGLQLLTAGGRKVHLEVGQTLVPRAHGIELVGAGFGGMVDDGVEFPGCQPRIEDAGGRRGGSALVDAAFDPDLSGAAVLPVGEEGDAVPCAHDLGQMVLE